MVWSWAHYKFSLGITNPARWFDIAGASGELFRLATKSLRKWGCLFAMRPGLNHNLFDANLVQIFFAQTVTGGIVEH